MRKTKLFVGVMAIIFLMAAGVVYAQPSEGKSSVSRSNPKEAMMKELNLTPEQREKLEANHKAHEEAMKNFHQAIKEQKDKLKEVLSSPDVTRASVEPIVSQMKALQAQMIDQRINGIFAAKTILTPEQFRKFQEKVEKRFEGKKERFQKKHEGKNEKRLMLEDEEFGQEPPDGPPPSDEPLPEPPMKAQEGAK